MKRTRRGPFLIRRDSENRDFDDAIGSSRGEARRFNVHDREMRLVEQSHSQFAT